MKTKLSIVLTCLSIALIPSLVSAKEIQMYDQPADTAKAVGKLDLSVGLIPIIVAPNGQWVKVGDPRNGNVGWVRVNEVNNNDGSSVTVTQKIINDGKGPSQYQSIEFGKPAKIMSQEEIQTQMRQWQNQRQNMQQLQQNIYQNMVNWIHEMNDPTGKNRELINNIANTVPTMVPFINQPVTQAPVKVIPPKPPQLLNKPTERITGEPGEPPKPGSSLERPARESTQPTEGLPATSPESGFPDSERVTGTKPAGPSR